jgi:hypothetical protein
MRITAAIAIDRRWRNRFSPNEGEPAVDAVVKAAVVKLALDNGSHTPGNLLMV